MLIDAANPANAERILHAAKQIGNQLRSSSSRMGIATISDPSTNWRRRCQARLRWCLNGKWKYCEATLSMNPANQNCRSVVSVIPRHWWRSPIDSYKMTIGWTRLLSITSPGHTAGSMSFYDTRDAALIVGDAFQTFGGTQFPESLNCYTHSRLTRHETKQQH